MLGFIDEKLSMTDVCSVASETQGKDDEFVKLTEIKSLSNINTSKITYNGIIYIVYKIPNGFLLTDIR